MQIRPGQIDMTQHTAEGVFQVFLGKRGGGRAAVEHSTVYQNHMVTEFRHTAEVMGGDQYQMPLFAQ